MDTTAADLAAAERAWTMTGAAYDVPAVAASLCVQAAALATQGSGAGGNAVTVTGTLQETGAGTNQFTYAASPADKLVIRYGNGSTVTFTVATFQTLASSFGAFFDADHALAFRYVAPGGADIQVNLSRNGGNTSASVQGTLTFQNVAHTLNVSRTGTVVAMVDSGYAESTANDTLSGSITAPGFSVQQVETRYSRYVIFMGTQTQNVIRQAASAFTLDGVAYDFLDAEVRKAFVNVAPGDLDYWRASGTLRRNGVGIGGLSLQNAPNALKVVLTINGQSEDLEVHAR